VRHYGAEENRQLSVIGNIYQVLKRIERGRKSPDPEGLRDGTASDYSVNAQKHCVGNVILQGPLFL